MLKKLIGIGAVMLSVNGAVWGGAVNFDQFVDLQKVVKQAAEAPLYFPFPLVPSGAVNFNSIFSKGYAFDSDVPAEIQKQIRDDMSFIGSIKGSNTSKLHTGIFGKVDGPVYTGFFESRVKAIGMDDCGNPNAVACVQPFFNPSKMWLTQNYIKFSHPQISRMMVVFHESRHTESNNGNWMHARCPRPFKDENGNDLRSIWTGALLEGQPACDTTPSGSYGSSMIMLKNIQKFCSNCTDKVRMDSGIYADDQFKRVIDPAAIKAIKEDLYR